MEPLEVQPGAVADGRRHAGADASTGDRGSGTHTQGA